VTDFLSMQATSTKFYFTFRQSVTSRDVSKPPKMHRFTAVAFLEPDWPTGPPTRKTPMYGVVGDMGGNVAGRLTIQVKHTPVGRPAMDADRLLSNTADIKEQASFRGAFHSGVSDQ
jgi:hypothetical protein